MSFSRPPLASRVVLVAPHSVSWGLKAHLQSLLLHDKNPEGKVLQGRVLVRMDGGEEPKKGAEGARGGGQEEGPTVKDRSRHLQDKRNQGVSGTAAHTKMCPSHKDTLAAIKYL